MEWIPDQNNTLSRNLRFMRVIAASLFSDNDHSYHHYLVTMIILIIFIIIILIGAVPGESLLVELNNSLGYLDVGFLG